MDDNTAIVLICLVLIGGIVSIFWSPTLSMHSQVSMRMEDEEDDDAEEEGDDDDDEEDDDEEDDDEEDDDDRTILIEVGSCPYKQEFDKEEYKLRYHLGDHTLEDLATWFVIVGCECVLLGYILGLRAG